MSLQPERHASVRDHGRGGMWYIRIACYDATPPRAPIGIRSATLHPEHGLTIRQQRWLRHMSAAACFMMCAACTRPSGVSNVSTAVSTNLFRARMMPFDHLNHRWHAHLFFLQIVGATCHSDQQNMQYRTRRSGVLMPYEAYKVLATPKQRRRCSRPRCLNKQAIYSASHRWTNIKCGRLTCTRR